jgi:hypothetical protein
VFLALQHNFTKINETPYAFFRGEMLKYSSTPESRRQAKVFLNMFRTPQAAPGRIPGGSE